MHVLIFSSSDIFIVKNPTFIFRYKLRFSSNKVTDGLELTWGNSEVIVAFLKKMFKRERFGLLLADCLKQAVEQIKIMRLGEKNIQEKLRWRIT